MVNSLLQQFGFSNDLVAATVAKAKDAALKNRLTADSASVGFLLLHIAETQHSFNRLLFGEIMPITPKTFRVSSDEIETTQAEIRAILESGREKLGANIANASPEFLQEHVETFLGKQTRQYMIWFLLHHSSYHLGQAELALKRGRLY